MADPNWHELDLNALEKELRRALPASEAEKMIWAFEQALSVARMRGRPPPLPARRSSRSGRPRGGIVSRRAVFEAFFRRSVSDEEWRVPLLAPARLITS